MRERKREREEVRDRECRGERWREREKMDKEIGTEKDRET